jgi:hypothetical protein
MIIVLYLSTKTTEYHSKFRSFLPQFRFETQLRSNWCIQCQRGCFVRSESVSNPYKYRSRKLGPNSDISYTSPISDTMYQRGTNQEPSFGIRHFTIILWIIDFVLIDPSTKRGKEKSRSNGHYQCEKEMDDHLLACQQIFEIQPRSDTPC